jgi:hypothetical protein
MSANLSRRHLFARLGGGLVALWTWLRGRQHAAANPAASVRRRRPHPPALWNPNGCGRSSPSCVVHTYDADGKLLSERRLDPSPEPPTDVRCEADGTITVTYADRPATSPVADTPTPPDDAS